MSLPTRDGVLSKTAGDSGVAGRDLELKADRQALPPATDLRDAAEQIKARSKSVFDKLDQVDQRFPAARARSSDSLRRPIAS